MDRQVAHLIAGEYNRQQHELEMIASENYVSKAVMDAYANVFTNKYSEGYPGKRYYGGQEWVDQLELLCQWRALRMFGLIDKEEPDLMSDAGYTILQEQLQASPWACNVQPLSGSPANLAVYLWCLEPGDTILGMDLGAGGHLTHGHPLNASGVYYNIVAYGVRTDNHRIDYADVRSKALEHQPSLILAGFSAYSRTIDWSMFAQICDEVEEVHGYRPLLMVDMAHVAGLISGGVYPDPFPHVDIVTTTTHKTLRGPRGGLIYTRKGTFQRNGKEVNLVKLIDRGVFPGMQGGPHEHIIAAKAVAFAEVIAADFTAYAKKVVANAQSLAQSLIDLGRPIVSHGTDNHLLMIDITEKNGVATGLDGKTAEHILEQVGISCNKNMIPFDKRSPMNPSGIRIGTPAVTTRGLDEADMNILAHIIDQALVAYDQEQMLATLKQQVQSLCERYPLWY